MKELNLVDVFCEVLSGLCLLALALPCLDIAGTDLRLVIPWLASQASAGAVAGVLIAAYMLGLVVDALGLAVGGCLEARWEWLHPKADEPSSEETRAFYRNASPQLHGYRDRQWAYASLYRNLLILLPIGTALWCVPILGLVSWPWLLAFICCAALLGLVLVRALKVLLKHYYRDLTCCYRGHCTD